MAVIAVLVFVVAYILIATERVPKMVTALAGAGVILGLGVASAEEAFYSPETGVDWDVIFLLLGMMIIVGVLRRTGVFEYRRHLGGEAGQGLTAAGDGAAGADHRRRLGLPGQRHHGAADRPGHPAGL